MYIKSGSRNLPCKNISAWANVGAPVSQFKITCGDEPHYAKGKQVYFNTDCQKRLIVRNPIHLKEMLPCLSMALLW